MFFKYAEDLLLWSYFECYKLWFEHESVSLVGISVALWSLCRVFIHIKFCKRYSGREI
jgi:hypothetical protein